MTWKEVFEIVEKRGEMDNEAKLMHDDACLTIDSEPAVEDMYLADDWEGSIGEADMCPELWEDEPEVVLKKGEIILYLW